jgi:membrane protein
MWLVLLWVFARLPRKPVPVRSAMRAALCGAVGFEVLKQAFAIYLDTVTASPTGRLFGPVIGLMVFAYFASRFLLFLTAWAAVAPDQAPEKDPDQAPGKDQQDRSQVPPPQPLSPVEVQGFTPMPARRGKV